MSWRQMESSSREQSNVIEVDVKEEIFVLAPTNVEDTEDNVMISRVLSTIMEDEGSSVDIQTPSGDGGHQSPLNSEAEEVVVIVENEESSETMHFDPAEEIEMEISQEEETETNLDGPGKQDVSLSSKSSTEDNDDANFTPVKLYRLFFGGSSKDTSPTKDKEIRKDESLTESEKLEEFPQYKQTDETNEEIESEETSAARSTNKFSPKKLFTDVTSKLKDLLPPAITVNRHHDSSAPEDVKEEDPNQRASNDTAAEEMAKSVEVVDQDLPENLPVLLAEKFKNVFGADKSRGNEGVSTSVQDKAAEESYVTFDMLTKSKEEDRDTEAELHRRTDVNIVENLSPSDVNVIQQKRENESLQTYEVIEEFDLTIIQTQQLQEESDDTRQNETDQNSAKELFGESDVVILESQYERGDHMTYTPEEIHQEENEDIYVNLPTDTATKCILQREELEETKEETELLKNEDVETLEISDDGNDVLKEEYAADEILMQEEILIETPTSTAIQTIYVTREGQDPPSLKRVENIESNPSVEYESTGAKEIIAEEIPVSESSEQEQLPPQASSHTLYTFPVIDNELTPTDESQLTDAGGLLEEEITVFEFLREERLQQKSQLDNPTEQSVSSGANVKQDSAQDVQDILVDESKGIVQPKRAEDRTVESTEGKEFVREDIAEVETSQQQELPTQTYYEKEEERKVRDDSSPSENAKEAPTSRSFDIARRLKEFLRPNQAENMDSHQSAHSDSAAPDKTVTEEITVAGTSQQQPSPLLLQHDYSEEQIILQKEAAKQDSAENLPVFLADKFKGLFQRNRHDEKDVEIVVEDVPSQDENVKEIAEGHSSDVTRRLREFFQSKEVEEENTSTKSEPLSVDNIITEEITVSKSPQQEQLPPQMQDNSSESVTATEGESSEEMAAKKGDGKQDSAQNLPVFLADKFKGLFQPTKSSVTDQISDDNATAEKSDVFVVVATQSQDDLRDDRPVDVIQGEKVKDVTEDTGGNFSAYISSTFRNVFQRKRDEPGVGQVENESHEVIDSATEDAEARHGQTASRVSGESHSTQDEETKEVSTSGFFGVTNRLKEFLQPKSKVQKKESSLSVEPESSEVVENQNTESETSRQGQISPEKTERDYSKEQIGQEGSAKQDSAENLPVLLANKMKGFFQPIRAEVPNTTDEETHAENAEYVLAYETQKNQELHQGRRYENVEEDSDKIEYFQADEVVETSSELARDMRVDETYKTADVNISTQVENTSEADASRSVGNTEIRSEFVDSQQFQEKELNPQSSAWRTDEVVTEEITVLETSQQEQLPPQTFEEKEFNPSVKPESSPSRTDEIVTEEITAMETLQQEQLPPQTQLEGTKQDSAENLPIFLADKFKGFFQPKRKTEADSNNSQDQEPDKAIAVTIQSDDKKSELLEGQHGGTREETVPANIVASRIKIFQPRRDEKEKNTNEPLEVKKNMQTTSEEGRSDAKSDDDTTVMDESSQGKNDENISSNRASDISRRLREFFQPRRAEKAELSSSVDSESVGLDGIVTEEVTVLESSQQEQMPPQRQHDDSAEQIILSTENSKQDSAENLPVLLAAKFKGIFQPKQEKDVGQTLEYTDDVEESGVASADEFDDNASTSKEKVYEERREGINKGFPAYIKSNILNVFQRGRSVHDEEKDNSEFQGKAENVETESDAADKSLGEDPASQTTTQIQTDRDETAEESPAAGSFDITRRLKEFLLQKNAERTEQNEPAKSESPEAKEIVSEEITFLESSSQEELPPMTEMDNDGEEVVTSDETVEQDSAENLPILLVNRFKGLFQPKSKGAIGTKQAEESPSSGEVIEEPVDFASGQPYPMDKSTESNLESASGDTFKEQHKDRKQSRDKAENLHAFMALSLDQRARSRSGQGDQDLERTGDSVSWIDESVDAVRVTPYRFDELSNNDFQEHLEFERTNEKLLSSGEQIEGTNGIPCHSDGSRVDALIDAGSKVKLEEKRGGNSSREGAESLSEYLAAQLQDRTKFESNSDDNTGKLIAEEKITQTKMRAVKAVSPEMSEMFGDPEKTADISESRKTIPATIAERFRDFFQLKRESTINQDQNDGLRPTSEVEIGQEELIQTVDVKVQEQAPAEMLKDETFDDEEGSRKANSNEAAENLPLYLAGKFREVLQPSRNVQIQPEHSSHELEDQQGEVDLQANEGSIMLVGERASEDFPQDVTSAADVPSLHDQNKGAPEKFPVYVVNRIKEIFRPTRKTESSEDAKLLKVQGIGLQCKVISGISQGVYKTEIRIAADGSISTTESYYKLMY